MRSNRTSRIAALLFALLFAGILFASLVLFLLKPKETVSYYENRTLAEKPAFSLSGLWDGSYFSEWEDYIGDHAVGRSTLLRLHTQLDLDVWKRPTVNDIVPTEDGKLLAYYPDAARTEQQIAADSAAMAEQCAAVNDLVTSYGGTFLYVAVPGQTSYFADSYPWFLSEQPEQFEPQRTALSAALSARGVPFLDLGDVYASLGNPDSFYSATDHHYTYSGAFAAYQAILQQVNQLSGLNFKVYTSEKMQFDTLENPFIGSRLRKIYGLADSEEHLTIGTFRQPVAFRRYEHGVPAAASCYALPSDSAQEISFTVYMGGDSAETCIQTDRPQLPNLLIFGDSFTNPLETLLYASCNEMRSLDLRHYQDQSLYDYVSAYRPDVVLCVRDYSVLLSPDGNGTLK